MKEHLSSLGKILFTSLPSLSRCSRQTFSSYTLLPRQRWITHLHLVAQCKTEARISLIRALHTLHRDIILSLQSNSNVFHHIHIPSKPVLFMKLHYLSNLIRQTFESFCFSNGVFGGLSKYFSCVFSVC